MIWATARTDGAHVIYTFDERFPDGVALRCIEDLSVRALF